MRAHLVGETREFHVVFARDEVDRETDFLQAMPEGGERTGTDISKLRARPSGSF